MGRKRNQGKARRAARAKAREEAGERRNNNSQTANPLEHQPLSAQLRQFHVDEGEGKCRHGFDPSVSTDISQFVDKFHSSFIEFVKCGNRSLPNCLLHATSTTVGKFAALWNDLATMEVAISVCLCSGTHHYLGGHYGNARDIAAVARYFEQYIAVSWIKLKQ